MFLHSAASPNLGTDHKKTYEGGGGGGGGGLSAKNIFVQGEIKWKKFLHANYS